MANVVTRGHKWARTTTHNDYGNRFRVMKRPTRIHSPTRKNNPHALGLVTQLPYNHANQSFDIWKPDHEIIQRKFPLMVHHIGHVNFTCGPAHELLTAHARGKPPNIEYSTKSTYRTAFADPDFRYVRGINVNRPGPTQMKDQVAAIGIVPAILLHEDEGKFRKLNKPSVPMLVLPHLVEKKK